MPSGDILKRWILYLSAVVGADEIALAIIVPEGAAVVPAFGIPDLVQRFPGAGGVGGGGHEEAFVGGAEVDPEFAIVVADGAGPDAFAVAVHLVPVELGADRGEIGDGVAEDRPADQVVGMQDDHAGGELEGG